MTHRPLVLELFESPILPQSAAQPTTGEHYDPDRQITVLPDGTPKVTNAFIASTTSGGLTTQKPHEHETSVALLPGCEAIGLC
ncbi:hypothetical protein [Streptomyces sp. NRRL F-5053]|uniref:hypothetical protein n=1 Tax=Streptomyces sp. NRRL F-5053 TaxID=1463854 RepID=UPI0004C745E1|nr:hypothetical protein [Streptomyces sp. NRRL F-5053]